ncbi:16S rRNA (adenine(1518)-N(6)/adenine(1519)-N(6))-dimethyltransferase RsmA [Candidatus Pacebacteria bacterium]|nr:16S rRNA (adenine(1518)-N(6)/adenine(1519)-N(6))-dimethyltransferase RsmA [Candidatus Paceibacterota bacterium]
MPNFKAKKSLGQNFLKSEKALSQIIEAAEAKEGDLVLEIGPGKGALTKKLLEAGAKVLSIEKDSRSVEFIKENFDEEIKEGKLDILEEDVLSFDETKIGTLKKFQGDEASYKLIANIPYYITGEILRKFLSSNNQPKSITVLVQKEVADRIVSKDKKESILSMSVKAYGDPKYVSTVKKEFFDPKPKVDSAILYISNISKEKFSSSSPPACPVGRLSRGSRNNSGITESEELKKMEDNFFKVLKTGFSQKRKQLGNNLSELVRDVDFEKCEIKKTDRAEELPIEKWFCLTQNLENLEEE